MCRALITRGERELPVRRHMMLGVGRESSPLTQRASGSANTYIALWPRTGLTALTTPR